MSTLMRDSRGVYFSPQALLRLAAGGTARLSYDFLTCKLYLLVVVNKLEVDLFDEINSNFLPFRDFLV